jgi:hypothetical protein
MVKGVSRECQGSVKGLSRECQAVVKGQGHQGSRVKVSRYHGMSMSRVEQQGTLKSTEKVDSGTESAYIFRMNYLLFTRHFKRWSLLKTFFTQFDLGYDVRERTRGGFRILILTYDYTTYVTRKLIRTPITLDSCDSLSHTVL